MDQNRRQGQSNQADSDARGQQQSKRPWDGNERRIGTPDRRQNGSQPHNRNTAEDVRMMNEGSSR
jgi:hypothetical protein